MSSHTQNSTVVLASGNAGKLRELARILSPLGVSLVSQAKFSVPEVEETGLCFVENAILKARDILSDPESRLKDLFDLASAAADDVRKIDAELQE